ncbi:MAG: zinc-dependent metalloprotease [Acidimicrobiia bacterium]
MGDQGPGEGRDGDPDDGVPAANPFEGIPFLGDLAKMMRGSGTSSWDTARQFAVQLASGGMAEPNPDPVERIRLEELVRVAEMRVADLTGLPIARTGGLVRMVPVTRAEWARRTIDGWRPLLERLSTALTTATPPPADASDPLTALLQGFSSAFGPLLFGMQAGSMVGHLAGRSLGQYDLPIPRPPGDELVVVAPNLNAFGADCNLPDVDLRLWLCVSELATHAVLGIPHVRAALDGLLLTYAGSFRVDPTALEERLGQLDPADPTGMQQALGDPATLLGAIESPAQRELKPKLSALVAVVEGYVDWVVDTVGGQLIANYPMLTEALRRRRVEAGEGDRFVEHLLGLELDQAQYERGERFVQGVLDRAGPAGLARLWEREDWLPTPAEVDAPGLWLARIDLPPDPEA